VVHVGAVPVLIDVDPQHFQLSIPELELAHAHEPLQACIVVHLFGWCHPDLELLRDFCKRCGIRLVEDAAQAFGVATKGPDGCDTPIFAGAEISTLSFYPAKVLGGCMDGGAVTTNSPELASCVRTLLNHGREKHYSFKQVGWNSRMSSVQGAYLRAAIQEVPFWIEERRTIMRRYHEQLSTAGFHVVNPPRGITGNGYLAAVLLPAERVAPVQAILAHEGIATGRVYPETIHQQTPATDAPRYSDLRISTEFTTRVLNLPLFPGLSEEEQNEVICTLVHKT
jgi:dTDP-4-amino-4,6-dideoxygalactose transaminase